MRALSDLIYAEIVREKIIKNNNKYSKEITCYEKESDNFLKRSTHCYNRNELICIWMEASG